MLKKTEFFGKEKQIQKVALQLKFDKCEKKNLIVVLLQWSNSLGNSFVRAYALTIMLELSRINS